MSTIASHSLLNIS